VQARELGVLSEHEALFLAEYDRKVMDIVNVDDFESHELGMAAAPDAVAEVEFGLPAALNQ
jgi:hypothetical protein